MGQSWKIGRMFGINVYVHPTFLLLLLFLAMSGRTAMGIALVVAAFGCILLHEFGHALTARRFGIGTDDITLYPIGGVARLDRIPRSPDAELLITLAGPAVNIAIAGFLTCLTTLIGLGEFRAGSFVQNLILFNIGVALFNMVPAFPMDGGRIFRALLSAVLGRLQATVIAARVGQTIAVAFGIYLLSRGLSQETILPIFIAFFIFRAAGSELASVRAEESRRRSVLDSEIALAPQGYHWVKAGGGRFRLAPILIETRSRSRPQWP